MSTTPAHYAGKVTPWDLEKCMRSSGNAFVDARRTDVIEYVFRLKGDLLGDLLKARHCLDEAISVLKAQETKDCIPCCGTGWVEIQSGPHLRKCRCCGGTGKQASMPEAKVHRKDGRKGAQKTAPGRTD